MNYTGPYKVGDQVIVCNKGSFGSTRFFGKVLTIEKIAYSPDLGRFYMVPVGVDNGIWLGEIRFLTKLEKALL